MTLRARTFAIVLGAGVAVFIARHSRGAMGRTVPGGIVIRHAGLYDALGHRLLLGTLFRRLATDIARVAPPGARVLEVGSGPGRLSLLLARERGLDVTGVDLDPAMIDRARANAERIGNRHRPVPSFVVGDVASLPFPDGSFDLVVSTLSLHHWADPTAGFREIGRVLRPGGRALVWDFRPGVAPFHARIPDPAEHVRGSSLQVANSASWRWPWRFTLTERTELVHADDRGVEATRSDRSSRRTAGRRGPLSRA